MLWIFLCVCLCLRSVSAWNGSTGYVSVASGGVSGEIFYWFFPPRNGDQSAPLVSWAQGGPGASSIELGLLRLNGPYAVSKENTSELVPREITWNEEFAMLYADFPVGTGYSYSSSGKYAQNQSEIAAMQIQVLNEVYSKLLWPKENGLYLTGESYSGHYLPALGAAILKDGSLPLLGVAIGDGLTDPEMQVVTKPSSAYYFGLIDQATREKAQVHASQAARFSHLGHYGLAKKERDIMEAIVLDASEINAYDVRTFQQYNTTNETLFLNASSTRDKLNISADIFFGTDPQVEDSLFFDIMKSYKHDIKFILLQGVPVLLYQGALDWKDGATSNDAWISTVLPDLHFSPRSVLYNKVTATKYGWIKSALPPASSNMSNLLFYDVVIANAGHMVPLDAPESAKDMITKFIRGNLTIH